MESFKKLFVGKGNSKEKEYREFTVHERTNRSRNPGGAAEAEDTEVDDVVKKQKVKRRESLDELKAVVGAGGASNLRATFAGTLTRSASRREQPASTSLTDHLKVQSRNRAQSLNDKAPVGERKRADSVQKERKPPNPAKREAVARKRKLLERLQKCQQMCSEGNEIAQEVNAFISFRVRLVGAIEEKQASKVGFSRSKSGTRSAIANAEESARRKFHEGLITEAQYQQIRQGNERMANAEEGSGEPRDRDSDESEEEVTGLAEVDVLR